VERKTVTVWEAAQIPGMSRGAAYWATRRSGLPVVGFGRRYLVPLSALALLLSETDYRSIGTGKGIERIYLDR
jgi:hypothetical protein